MPAAAVGTGCKRCRSRSYATPERGTVAVGAVGRPMRPAVDVLLLLLLLAGVHTGADTIGPLADWRAHYDGAHLR